MEDAKKINSGGGDSLLEATGRTAWTEFVMSVIENRNIQESQHIDSCSSNKQLQDVASLAALDAYLDPTMAQDANVSWGLRKVIPLSQNVDYWAADGTTRPMTLARAMAAEKRHGEAEKRCGDVVSIVDHTPPSADFLRNSNTSNRVQQNRLEVPTAAAAAARTSAAVLLTSAPAPISMVKRGMKRAGDVFFNGGALPGRRRSAGKVRAQLSQEDPAYTLIVNDYKEEKCSQELFQFCLAQASLE